MDRALWLRVIRVFAELDCLFSLAKASMAIGEPACRPEFIEGEDAWVDFTELRHPTLSCLKSFIPNDVKIGGDVGKIVLLTGASCYNCLHAPKANTGPQARIWRMCQA